MAVLAPLATEGSDGPGSHWAVGFWIADADAGAAAAAELGGTVLAAPQEMPMFRRAVLADPGGAVFTISQLMLAG
jgi:predicted enzyme related to lactoylglutathione lyase